MPLINESNQEGPILLKPSAQSIMTKKDNKKLNIIFFWLILSLSYVLAFTVIEFVDNPFSGLKGFITILAQVVLVGLAASGIVGLICSNKYIFAIFFPLLLLVSSLYAYYRLTMGIALSAAIMELIFINDIDMWLTVIDYRVVSIIITIILISIISIYIRFKYVLDNKNLLVFIISLLVIIITNFCSGSLKYSVQERMPYIFYYAYCEYKKNKKMVIKERNSFEKIEVKVNGIKPNIVLIIGESLRADHLSLNGYKRKTTPNLEKLKNVISYTNLYSNYPTTHLSVPHMLTRADSVSEERAYYEESFISLFRKAGYKSIWISNQDKNPNYSYFMEETDSLIMNNPGWMPRNFRSVYDNEMITHVRNFYKQNKKFPMLIIVHTIGSHWIYNLNHPKEFAVYKPEVNSKVLSELSIDQINNSYDNTVLATDKFISDVISIVKNDNTLLIYMSDHGENLGENGQFLHATLTENVAHSACVFWYSDKYYDNYSDKILKLKNNSNKYWNTDILFHTIIDAANFNTSVLDSTLSVMK